MKIIQAIGWYYPESVGGTEVYVAALAQCQQSAGHDVSIAVPLPGAECESLGEHDSIPVFRFPIVDRPSRDECQERMAVRGAERLHAWFAEQSADVVHFHTFVTGLGVWEVEAAKRSGAKVVCTSHSSSLGYICQRGTLMHWGEKPCDGICQSAVCAACELQHRGISKWAARCISQIPVSKSESFTRLPGRLGSALGMPSLIARRMELQRRVLASADRFVVLTQRAREIMIANGASPESIVLNRLGVSQPAVANPPSPDESPTEMPIRIGYVGRFDPIKGVHDLARAIAELELTLPIEVEFRGPLDGAAAQQVIRELREILNDDSRVSFAGAVRSEEIPKILADYDVLCCPAVCLEGGPTVALEAQAAGTPVIGTRIGGLTEIVSDGIDGRLVEPGDYRALAGVIRDIADQPADTVDQWRRHLPQVRTMDLIAHDYLTMYDQLLSRQRSSVSATGSLT